MKPLPNQFDGHRDQRDFQFSVLQRSGDVVLLEKHFKPGLGDQSRRFYEVCRVKKVPQKMFPGGRVMEAHEALPSPEEWGVDGWSYAILEDAQTRFSTLIGQNKEILSGSV